MLLGIFVFTLFTASFVYKLTEIIKKSKVDGQNRFTVFVVTQREKTIDHISFLSIDPQTNSISILAFKNIPKKLSLETAEIGIPYDSYIVSEEKIDDKNAPSFFTKLMFSKDTATNLTIIDIARLYFFATSVSGKSVQLVEIEWPFDDSKKSVVEDLFFDQKILKENLSIQIVNATGESGVGSLFARMTGFLGGNVVSVTTSDSEKKESEILFLQKKQYTHDKLHRMFQFVLIEMKKEGIADIIIVIGKDYKKSFRKL